MLFFYLGGSLLQFWEVAGTTFIHDNFIRLTADQTSAKGQIWNTLVSIIPLTANPTK